MDSAKAPCMLGIGCVGTETWTSFMVSAVESLEFQVELSFRGVVAPLRWPSFSSVGVRVDESSSDWERRMGRLSSSLVREEEEERL